MRISAISAISAIVAVKFLYGDAPAVKYACRVCGARVTDPKLVVCSRCFRANAKKSWRPR